MPVTRVGLLSVHTSPVASLGTTDAGGMNLYVQKLALTLGRMGVQVDVLTRRTDPDSKMIQQIGEGARLVQLQAGPTKHVPKSVLPIFVPQLTEALRAFVDETGREYDVLHSHYWLSGLVATRFKQEWGTPVVHMFHTLSRVKEFYFGGPDPSDSMLRADGERAIIERADAVVGATCAEREEMTRLYGRAPSRYDVIPPGVDTELFHPLDKLRARASLGLPAKDRIALFVGRLDPIKGLDALMRTIADVRDRVPGRLNLVVVGEHGAGRGDVLSRYRLLALKLGIADAVCFHDIVDQPRLAQLYSSADICAIPSAYESFGMVATEAMACQTPVVAYRVGGLAATIRDGETGLLAHPGDRQDFGDKLVAALENPERLETMGRRARLSMQRYRWECVARRSLGLYEQMIHDRMCLLSPASGQG